MYVTTHEPNLTTHKPTYTPTITRANRSLPTTAHGFIGSVRHGTFPSRTAPSFPGAGVDVTPGSSAVWPAGLRRAPFKLHGLQLEFLSVPFYYTRVRRTSLVCSVINGVEAMVGVMGESGNERRSEAGEWREAGDRRREVGGGVGQEAGGRR
ncbi:hypothetical protein E2C01_053462 [Portunus trituberculatus]|uniref:Uncharacterized protein n=1 Tax=Portunus trituberculatus TaxID=210409 RepID=A0A5B7GPF1_PORTR|nr:hypothetical protein [Portunus trituberculatus]